MPKCASRPPKYCKYRQGVRVRIGDKQHYLPGSYNSMESLAEYIRLIGEWAACQSTDQDHVNCGAG